MKKCRPRTAGRFVLSLLAMPFLLISCAATFEQGMNAYNSGDARGAVRLWSMAASAGELDSIVILARAYEHGIPGTLDPNAHMAAELYKRALALGYVPAAVAIGAMHFNSGDKKTGIEWIRHAARWNDENARDLLKSMKEEVPPPDLYNEAMRARAAEAERLAEQRQRNAELALYLTAKFLQGYNAGMASSAPATLSAPVALPTNPSSPPPRSTSSALSLGGLDPKMPDLGKSLQESVRLAPSSSTDTISSPSARVATTVAASPRLCPDGTYVNGECRLAPDDTYVGGQPRIAPDGSYVAGRPRMAPDGSYVGGEGAITMCPDGSFVVGRCRMAPDGSYVGQ